MEHTIVIFKKLKERNENGDFNFRVRSRFTITQEEIEKWQSDLYNENIDADDEYEYYAELEETKH